MFNNVTINNMEPTTRTSVKPRPKIVITPLGNYKGYNLDSTPVKSQNPVTKFLERTQPTKFLEQTQPPTRLDFGQKPGTKSEPAVSSGLLVSKPQLTTKVSSIKTPTKVSNVKTLEISKYDVTKPLSNCVYHTGHTIKRKLGNSIQCSQGQPYGFATRRSVTTERHYLDNYDDLRIDNTNWKTRLPYELEYARPSYNESQYDLHKMNGRLAVRLMWLYTIRQQYYTFGNNKPNTFQHPIFLQHYGLPINNHSNFAVPTKSRERGFEFISMLAKDLEQFGGLSDYLINELTIPGAVTSLLGPQHGSNQCVTCSRCKTINGLPEYVTQSEFDTGDYQCYHCFDDLHTFTEYFVVGFELKEKFFYKFDFVLSGQLDDMLSMNYGDVKDVLDPKETASLIESDTKLMQRALYNLHSMIVIIGPDFDVNDKKRLSDIYHNALFRCRLNTICANPRLVGELNCALSWLNITLGNNIKTQVLGWITSGNEVSNQHLHKAKFLLNESALEECCVTDHACDQIINGPTVIGPSHMITLSECLDLCDKQQGLYCVFVKRDDNVGQNLAQFDGLVEPIRQTSNAFGWIHAIF